MTRPQTPSGAPPSTAIPIKPGKWPKDAQFYIAPLYHKITQPFGEDKVWKWGDGWTPSSKTREFLEQNAIRRPEPRTTKFCPACEQDLPIDNYYVKGNGILVWTCKSCQSKRAKERYVKQ